MTLEPEQPHASEPANSQPKGHSPAFFTLVRVFGSIPNSRITFKLFLAFTVGLTALITISHVIDPPLAGYDLDDSATGTFAFVGLAAFVAFTSLQGANLPLSLLRLGGSLDYAWQLDVPPWKVPTAVMVCALRTFGSGALVMMLMPAVAIWSDAAMFAGLVLSTVLGALLWSSVSVALTLTIKRPMFFSYAFVLFDMWVLNLLLDDTPFYNLSLVRHVVSPFLSWITVSGSDEFEPGHVPDVTPVAVAVPVLIAVTIAATLLSTWRVKHLMRKTTAAASEV